MTFLSIGAIMKKQDFIRVRYQPAGEKINSFFVRVDQIVAIKEVYAKHECDCGLGNCKYGEHRFDELYVLVQGIWYFAGSFDCDGEVLAIDRLLRLVNDTD